MTRVIGIKAEYCGHDVYVGMKYDKADVHVKAIMSDNTIADISHTIFGVSNTLVSNLGINEYLAKFRGFTAKFVVNGITKFEDLHVIRTRQDIAVNGETFPSGYDFKQEQFKTYIKRYDGSIRKLSNGEYAITHNNPLYDTFTVNYKPSENRISKRYNDIDELAYINMRYEEGNDSIDKKVNIRLEPSFIDMKIWYEGLLLNNAEDIRPEMFVIYMRTESGRWLSIPKDFPGMHYNIKGNDDYTALVTVTYQKHELSDKLERKMLVPLYKPLYVIDDAQFNVIYHDKFDGDIDVTFIYEDEFTYNDTMIIGWNKFMTLTYKNGLRGDFTVTAPKRTGLDNRFATVWDVSCDRKTLKATVIKIYNETFK